MIPFEFEYYKPDTVEEAVQKFKELDSQGKEPLYYSGGSEIISMARVSSIHPGAVIDLKGIPDCKVLEFQGEFLVIGHVLPFPKFPNQIFFLCLNFPAAG
jgi:CO/xanthine dehydrogenase FAD-binding subunit